MRAFLVLVLLALAAYAQATPVPAISLTSVVSSNVMPTNKAAAPGEYCPTCVSFMNQTAVQLLKIILDVGVVGGCYELCGYLEQELEQVVCNLLCDYAGIQAFIALIDVVDQDPIYICEEIGVCPIARNARASFKLVSTSPARGPIGTSFQLLAQWQVNSTIGTGEFKFVILPPSGTPLQGGFLIVNFRPGPYASGFTIRTHPSQYHPFLPGNYIVQTAICEGSCGSSHPYTKTLAKGSSSFVITA